MGKPISQEEDKEAESRSKEAALNVAPHHGIRLLVTGKTRAGGRVSSEGLFLGVDGGGTKTQAVVMDSSGRVLGEGASGASNPLRAGLDQAMENIVSSAAQAAEEAGLRMAQITSAVVALAGI